MVDNKIEKGTIVYCIILVVTAIIYLIRNWNDEDNKLVKCWFIFYICNWSISILIYSCGYNKNYIFKITNLLYYVILDILNSIVCFSNISTTNELQTYILSITIIMYVGTVFYICEYKSNTTDENTHTQYEKI